MKQSTKRYSIRLLAFMISLPMIAGAADDLSTAATATATEILKPDLPEPPPIKVFPTDAAGKAAKFFRKPVFLRGTLGDAPIQMKLNAKTEIEEGLEGSYVRPDQQKPVLLAGEWDEDTVFLEESVDGSSISAEWNGRVNGKVFSGTWKPTDEGPEKPFTLKISEPKRGEIFK